MSEQNFSEKNLKSNQMTIGGNNPHVVVFRYSDDFHRKIRVVAEIVVRTIEKHSFQGNARLVEITVNESSCAIVIASIDKEDYLLASIVKHFLLLTNNENDRLECEFKFIEHTWGYTKTGIDFALNYLKALGLSDKKDKFSEKSDKL